MELKVELKSTKSNLTYVFGCSSETVLCEVQWKQHPVWMCLPSKCTDGYPCLPECCH